MSLPVQYLFNRKQLMSIQHYQQKLLLKCWLSWQHYVSLERQRKDVHAEQDATRNKMASFLQAAGKLNELFQTKFLVRLIVIGIQLSRRYGTHNKNNYVVSCSEWPIVGQHRRDRPSRRSRPYFTNLGK